MKFIPITPSTLNVMTTCPRQFEAKYVTKEVEFKESEQIIWGNKVHKAFENRIALKTELPEEMEALEPWAQSFEALGGKIMAEVNLAITEDGQPTSWRDRYMGARADLVVIKGDVAFVGDLKTGKLRKEDTQLNILTTCLYGVHPQVKQITAALFYPFIDELYGFTTRRETFTTPKLDADIARYKQILEDDAFTPTPNGLCRGWCDVMSCEFNGRR